MPSDKSFTANYALSILGINYDVGSSDFTTINLPNVVLQLNPYSDEDRRYIGTGEIKTSLSLRDGEKVVVGTASIKDKAMILVLTARILK